MRHRRGAVARVSHHVQIDGRERQSECEGVEHDDDRQAPTDGVSGRQPSHHATEDRRIPAASRLTSDESLVGRSYSLRVLLRNARKTTGRLLHARFPFCNTVITPSCFGLPQAHDGEHHFRHRRRTLGQIFLCLAPRAKRVRRAGVRAWRPSTAIS